MWRLLISKRTLEIPSPPKFPALEDRIYNLDLATRTLKLKLSSYNFYVIRERRILATLTPSSPILIYDSDTSFVLQGPESTPTIVYDRTRNHPAALHAEQVLSSIIVQLKRLGLEAKELGTIVGTTLRGRFREEIEMFEEVGMLEEWVGRIKGRMDRMWERLDEVLAMESGGWEVGVVAAGVGEWEFEMSRGQWSRRA